MHELKFEIERPLTRPVPAGMGMFPLLLTKTSNVSLQQGLSQGIRDAITNGQVLPGQGMPSSHELAEYLSVSRSTVVKVYRHLISEGYLEARTGSGTYVSRHQRPGRVFDQSVSLKAYSELDQCSDADGTEFGVSPDGDLLSENAEERLDFSPSAGSQSAVPNAALPALDLLPFKQWSRSLLRHCKPTAIKNGCTEQQAFGHWPLREAMASYLCRTKAVNCRAKQVIVFAGRQSALYFASLLLVNQGDRIVHEDPCNLADTAHFEARGGVLIPVDVDADGLCVDALDQTGESCKLAYVSPMHHCPSGAALSMERRMKLLQWAKKEGAYILEDASDSDFHYTPPPLLSLQGLDDRGTVVYMYSLCTALEPMLTTTVLVVPEHMIGKCMKIKQALGDQMPIVEQAALATLMEQRQLDRHICSSRAAYRVKRQTLIFNLVQQFRTSVQIPNYSGGLQQLIRLHLPLSEEAVLQAAGQAGLLMLSTRTFYSSAAPDLEFLVPFSALTLDAIQETVRKFAEATLKKPDPNPPSGFVQEPVSGRGARIYNF